MLLIICGGLGFIVWDDLMHYRKTKHLYLHTKIVLMMTAILIVAGTIPFLIVEWNNPLTMGNMNIGDKILNSMFQSVTCRTAGFDSLNNAHLDPVSKVFSMILMYIGASPASTGGGIKVTTFAVILMTVVSVLRNKEETIIFGRRVDKSTVYKALTITMISLSAIFISSLLIFYSLKDNVLVSGLDTMFEVVSAFATVGLTSGITAVTNLFSEIILILMMFIGRVGPISVMLLLTLQGAEKTNKQVYPEGKILVG
jgi:trk system potassium uptake protein TrkH